MIPGARENGAVLRSRRKQQEGGFALLLIFLMGAILALSLYMEIPRVAFQTQRQKEQMLMERGDQYKLAIRRYWQANSHQWPPSMEALENTNNRRFLRRRYKDPMTGKDEWRVIHISNGVLTDSVNSKQKQDKDKGLVADNFVAEMAPTGPTGTGPAGVNAATRRRASDNNALPGVSSGTGDGTVPPNGSQPSGPPPVQGTNQPGMYQPGAAPGGLQPGQNLPPGVPGAPPQPGMPGAPVNSQTGGVSPSQAGGSSFVGASPFVGGGTATGAQPNNPTGQGGLYAGQSPYPTGAGASGGSPGFPGQPGTATGQQNPAMSMIQGLLTSPRPGGLAAVQAQQGMSMGTGIAGVASNLDADAIMVYDDKTNYSEWEFVFDPTKWHQPANPEIGRAHV
jgi:hypothetical protein